MLRRRLLPHALYFFVFWPIGSALFAVLAIREQSVASDAAPILVVTGSLLGAWHLIAEFAWCAALLTIVTVALFSLLDSDKNDDLRLLPWIEPLLFTLAFAAGLALEYPAVLRHSLFRAARNATVLQATIGTIVILVVFATLIGARRKKTVAYVATVAAIILAGWATPFIPLRGANRDAQAKGIVLLGIDSLSARDDVSTLRSLAAREKGTWYEAAVSPALVTNAVWTAILTHRLPNENGLGLIWQDYDWKKAPYNLAGEANRRGFETWSFLSSQFTCYLGSRAGFDHDRSSPLGWLYMSTGFVKDSSIFLPVLLPRLPRLPFARSPRNQEGTFAYDLGQDIRDALTAGSGEHPAFVIAHFDYLHAYGYPRYRDLGRTGTRIVRAATVNALQDQSLDPEMPEIEGDPLALGKWKVGHIQRVLDEQLRSAKFLAKGNKLVVLSDHGARKGLSEGNFGNPAFFHVVLTTFGLPARDPRAPISIADVPALIDMPAPDVTQPIPPLVQHAMPSPEERAVIQQSIVTGKRGSGLKLDGRVILDPLVVRAVMSRLTTFVPLGPRRGYWRVGPDGTLIPLPTRAVALP